jgi:hypothetical protein
MNGGSAGFSHGCRALACYLTMFPRGAELALKLEPLIREKAKERQVATLKRGDKMPVVQTSAPRGNSDKNKARNELAKIAGVSHDTLTRSKVIAREKNIFAAA